MGFNVLTYALAKNLRQSSLLGIKGVRVSDNRKGIVFVKNDDSELFISQPDWNAITKEEKEKISKIVISRIGKTFLAEDGEYKPISYNDIISYVEFLNKPRINGITLEGDKTIINLQFSSVAESGSYDSIIGTPAEITENSQLTNDIGYVNKDTNSLTNYYSKSETFNKTEIENLIALEEKFDAKIVDTLPTTDISNTTIYLIKDPVNSSYAQWFYLDNQWITVGSTEVSLTSYYTKSEIDSLMDGKVVKVTGYNLSQENFSPEEKEKLSNFVNFILPKATQYILGGVKVDNKTIFIKDGVISTPNGGGFAPGNVSDLSVVPGNITLTVKWKDPNDIIKDGVDLSIWKGTRLVYKAGSYPKNYLDGILAVDNTIRNQYSENGFTISGLQNGETYYFQLFPYNNLMNYNQDEVNRIEGTPVAPIVYKTMSVVIDTTNSNPETSVTYINDAVGMEPGSAEWDEWFKEYPCLFKDGVEIGRLNPNNFAQFEDGTPADITSGLLGDVMIAFPRRGLKIENIGTDIVISMTDAQDDESFEYYAHQKGTVKKDVFYLGAYMSTLLGSKIVCLSGGQPYKLGTIGQNRTYIRNKGTGYDIFGFYQLMFIQAMYVLKYKNLDSQTVMGMGNTNNSGGILWHGGTDNKGMNYAGSNPTSGKTSMKLFGLCDLWGNIWQYIDGVFCNANGELLIATTGFNSSGTGYMNYGKIRTGFSGFISNIIGTTETGFIPKDNAGSSTTYYCDSTNITNGRMMRLGGSVSSNTAAGIFYALFDILDSSKDMYSGTRIMYL